jgi:flagellar protein FliO/FliZ
MLRALLNRQLLVLLLFVTQMALPSAVFAGDGLGSDAASYLRMIWGLLVVLGVILVLYGIVRKRFSLLSPSPGGNIKILEVKAMMGKKALCLVDVKGQEYLLGISGETISHIATLTPPAKTSFAAALRATEVPPQS